MANIEPDKNGVVEFKRADLGAHQQLLFVAVDPQNTVSRIVALPDVKSEYLDLRLAKGLDPKLHYTQQKLISILQAKGTLVVPDITSTHFEAYDSIPRVFSLYAALNGDPKLVEFNFIKTWPTLKLGRKAGPVSQIRQPRIAFLPLQERSRVLQDGDSAVSGEQEGKAVLGPLVLGRRFERLSQAVEFRAAQHLGADSA